MPVISDAQIAAAAKAGGLTRNVGIAVAIALAESGGNTNAYNARPPDNSYGLWQINMLGPMGPARRAQFGLSSNVELFDPVKNARAMVALSSNGFIWTSWSTYTRGTYRQYLARGNVAAGTSAEIPLSDTTALALPGSDALDSIKKFAQLVSDPGFWLRVFIGVMGAVLMGFALYQMGSQLPGVKQVRNITTDAAKLIALKKAK